MIPVHLPQFEENYDKYKMRQLVEELVRAFARVPSEVSSTTIGTVPTIHNSLTGREDPDCHPISAITGLQIALDSKQDTGDLGLTDHGALLGLTDDDHVQYIRHDGTRAFTGTQDTLLLRPTVHLGSDLGENTRRYDDFFGRNVNLKGLVSTGTITTTATGGAIAVGHSSPYSGTTSTGSVTARNASLAMGFSSTGFPYSSSNVNVTADDGGIAIGTTIGYYGGTGNLIVTSDNSGIALGFSAAQAVLSHGTVDSSDASIAIGKIYNTGPSSSTAEIAATGGNIAIGYLRRTGGSRGVVSVTAAGEGSFACGNAYHLVAGGVGAGPVCRIYTNSKGTFAQGSVVAYSGGNASVLEVISTVLGGFAQGYIRTTNAGATINRIRVSGSGSGGFAQGAILNAGALAAYIEVSDIGGFAQGYCTGTGGDIRVSNRGGFAQGMAVAGDILVSGRGGMAHGYTAGGSITASSYGTVAFGATSGTGYILASGRGAAAVGSASSGSNIIASATNSVQFGPGSNSLADSVKIGTAGIRFKGTSGAPGAPANGDQWRAGNYVYIRSNSLNVKLAANYSWTTAGYTVLRNITTLTAPLTTITAPAYTPDFTIGAVTDSSAVATFGFANANEGNTLINVVRNLQVRQLELARVINTFISDARTANLIR
jgi:hypothetical protein